MRKNPLIRELFAQIYLKIGTIVRNLLHPVFEILPLVLDAKLKSFRNALDALLNHFLRKFADNVVVLAKLHPVKLEISNAK